MEEYRKLIVSLVCSFAISIMFYYFYLYLSLGMSLMGYSMGYAEILGILIFIIFAAYTYRKYISLAWAVGLTLAVLGAGIIFFILLSATIGYIIFGPLMTEAGFNIIAAVSFIGLLAVGFVFVLLGMKIKSFTTFRKKQKSEEDVYEA